MLTFAKNQQWDQLIEMEMDYLKSVEIITKMIKPTEGELINTTAAHQYVKRKILKMKMRREIYYEQD